MLGISLNKMFCWHVWASTCLLTRVPLVHNQQTLGKSGRGAGKSVPLAQSIPEAICGIVKGVLNLAHILGLIPVTLNPAASRQTL